MHIDHINIRAPRALLEQVRDFYCVFFRDPASTGLEVNFPRENQR